MGNVFHLLGLFYVSIQEKEQKEGEKKNKQPKPSPLSQDNLWFKLQNLLNSSKWMDVQIKTPGLRLLESLRLILIIFPFLFTFIFMLYSANAFVLCCRVILISHDQILLYTFLITDKNVVSIFGKLFCHCYFYVCILHFFILW